MYQNVQIVDRRKIEIIYIEDRQIYKIDITSIRNRMTIQTVELKKNIFRSKLLQNSKIQTTKMTKLF